jgi:TetR/AcrR family transcriptional regulator, tetracycline repressor protein
MTSRTAPSLSRERAVATAIAILDEKGTGGLTMRALAREMGVPLMSLYRHVTSKDDLDSAIVDALLRSIPPLPESTSWEACLRRWARAYRAMARAHPNAGPLFAARPAAGYGARAGDVETILGELGDAGLAPDEARVRLRAALITITGFCSVQAASERVDEGERLAETAARDHPRLAALAVDLRERRHDDRVFEAMVDSVLAGIRTALPG